MRSHGNNVNTHGNVRAREKTRSEGTGKEKTSVGETPKMNDGSSGKIKVQRKKADNDGVAKKKQAETGQEARGGPKIQCHQTKPAEDVRETRE